ncbi:type II toxin-antitoxin system VapC family toxin [Candidatus Bathyarchaeota archaeon]|nr:MAG: type II toxin-antitoxin system VapC family toxin [Candidatus Bathyarchaeota archaeon]
MEIVIDSSVAVKWFSSESATNEALALRNGHINGTRDLWVSDLLYHEVANALRYKPEFDKNKLAIAVQDLFGYHLNTRPIDPDLLNAASAIAYRSEITIYDAIPVALAKLRGTVCITADENTQFKRTKAKGYPVQLLSKETL